MSIVSTHMNIRYLREEKSKVHTIEPVHEILLLIEDASSKCTVLPSDDTPASIQTRAVHTKKLRQYIRIYHACEGTIEKSVPRIAIWHWPSDDKP